MLVQGCAPALEAGLDSMKREWEHAIHTGDLDRIGGLFRGGAEVNPRDRSGETGLMIAARQGRSNLAQLLVDQGADLNPIAQYSLTALMPAVIHGHVDVVPPLVKAEADLEIRGSGASGFQGKPARELAARNRPDSFETLQGSGRKEPDVLVRSNDSQSRDAGSCPMLECLASVLKGP
jgi:hypothetical protein